MRIIGTGNRKIAARFSKGTCEKKYRISVSELKRLVLSKT